MKVATTGDREEETRWQRWHLAGAAAACWSLLISAFVLDHVDGVPETMISALYLGAYLTGGTLAARAAIVDLTHGRVNVDLLMVAAAIGAASVGAWNEGAILLGLFSTSNALEHAALERTRRAVRSLMELTPDVATRLQPGDGIAEETVRVEALVLGDLVLVRPGERVPVDGVVVAGDSSIDQAAITGESIPVVKKPGDPVFAATMNQHGALQVQVTRLATESTLAKIVAFVEDAREQKSRTQRFTDRFEGTYAIGVIVASALVFLIPYLFLDAGASDAFYRAMTLLVVASPCALVISTPASTLSGLANAARNGVLFKGGGHLENAGTIRTFAFDKTGTLTYGKPRLTDVVVTGTGWSEQEALLYAASAERLSEHPLADAIVSGAIERGLAPIQAIGFRSVTGKGIVAQVDGHEVAIGNDALFLELGVAVGSAAAIADELREQGKTAMLVGDTHGVYAVVAVADTVRPDAKQAIAELRALGVRRIVMLTGDHHRVAAAIAAELGVDDVRADLLPEDKLTTIRALLAEGPVAMVGDGVNDAPALAMATLGIAMGGAGTDVALETADVVLMSDDLRRLPYAIDLSRRTRRTILQNLGFSLTVIVTLVLSTLVIGIPLPLGVVGHEGSTIIVVSNGLRLLRTPRRWRRSAHPAAA